MSHTRVRFVEAGSGILSLLEVDSDHGRGLFGRITAALFLLRVQLVRAESKVLGGRRLERLWVVEFDGAPIRPHRRLEIQTEVLSAVESESATRRSYLTSSSPRRPLDEEELPPSAA